MLKVFKVNMRDNPSTMSTYQMISVFLMPAMILSDIVTMYEKNLVQRFKPNFFFGFLSSALAIVSTMGGFVLASRYNFLGSEVKYTWQMMLSMSCFLNLSSDSGYRLVKTLGATELYKIIREKFIINFLIIIGLVYALRDENVEPDSSNLILTFRYLGMTMFSIAIGIFLGVTFTLIQNRSTSLRSSAVADIQFILFFVFTCHFAIQIDTDYICDEIPLVFLGLVIAGFSKFNMSAEAVRRFIFLLEILSKLAKLLTMTMMGLVIPDALLDLNSLKKISLLYMIFLPLTLVSAIVHLVICKLFGASEGPFGFKEFITLYCTSMSKGPLAFLLARKYFSFSDKLLDEIDLFIFTSMLVFDPLSYCVTRFLPVVYKGSLENQVRTRNEEIMTKSEASTWEKVLAHLSDRVFSPLLINNYRRRKEDGELDLICNIENSVINRSEFNDRTLNKVAKGLQAMGVFSDDANKQGIDLRSLNMNPIVL